MPYGFVASVLIALDVGWTRACGALYRRFHAAAQSDLHATGPRFGDCTSSSCVGLGCPDLTGRSPAIVAFQTSRLPEDDRYSVSMREYLADIDVCMGGRVAEDMSKLFCAPRSSLVCELIPL